MIKETKTNEIPNGWIETSIEEISERIHYGYTASAESKNTGIRLLRITDIQNHSVDWSQVPFCKISGEEVGKYELKEGDLVFARTGATVGKSYLLIGKIPKTVFASYLIRIILYREVNKFFVYYFFQSPSYWQQIGMQALGIGQPNVNATTLSKLSIPLSPLAEQHRIVAKIEELFSDLEDGIDSLKKAQAQLKTYRQAVLKYAFEGTLTAAWRQQHQPEPVEKLLAQIKAERERQNAGNGKTKKPKEFLPLTEAELAALPKLPEGWRWVKLENIANKITDGEHIRPKIVESGIYFLSAKDIRGNGVSFDNPLYVTKKDAEIYRRRCNPERGDILIVSRGATVGRMCIVETDEIFCLLGSVILIKVGQHLNSDYLTYILKSPFIQKILLNISGSTAQQAIYLRDIKNIVIPICLLEEQNQIVQEIESRLSVCDKLEEGLKESLQKAEALRQSILKKAFEGRLAPQDPNDEPAEKLLERIQAAKS